MSSINNIEKVTLFKIYLTLFEKEIIHVFGFFCFFFFIKKSLELVWTMFTWTAVTFILNNEWNCCLYIQHQSDSDTNNIIFQINKHLLCRCASTQNNFMSFERFHVNFLTNFIKHLGIWQRFQFLFSRLKRY